MSHQEASIKPILESTPEVYRVLNLITMQFDSRVMVAVKAKMAKVDSVEQLIISINKFEAILKKENPAIQWIFFEPDIKE